MGANNQTAAFKAIKVRGYGFGLKRDIHGDIGVFVTKEEAAAAANAYTSQCVPSNCPDSYDFGVVVETTVGA